MRPAFKGAMDTCPSTALTIMAPLGRQCPHHEAFLPPRPERVECCASARRPGANTSKYGIPFAWSTASPRRLQAVSHISLQSMFASASSIPDSIQPPDSPCRPFYAFSRLPALSLAASTPSWSTLVRPCHSQFSVVPQSQIQERRSSSEALVFLRAVPSPAIPPWWVAASMLPTR